MPPRGPGHWCQADQLPARVESATKMRKLRGVDLISDALPFGRLWYDEPNAISNAIGYPKFRSRLILVDHHTVDHAGFAGAVIIDINASARFD
jgi:hypothetical protein